MEEFGSFSFTGPISFLVFGDNVCILCVIFKISVCFYYCQAICHPISPLSSFAQRVFFLFFFSIWLCSSKSSRLARILVCIPHRGPFVRKRHAAISTSILENFVLSSFCDFTHPSVCTSPMKYSNLMISIKNLPKYWDYVVSTILQVRVLSISFSFLGVFSLYFLIIFLNFKALYSLL